MFQKELIAATILEYENYSGKYWTQRTKEAAYIPKKVKKVV